MLVKFARLSFFSQNDMEVPQSVLKHKIGRPFAAVLPIYLLLVLLGSIGPYKSLSPFLHCYFAWTTKTVVSVVTIP